MSGKKQDRDIVDRRLEETLDLFQPTARQAAAADEIEEKTERKAVPKSRGWDAENPAFSFRILPEDNDQIQEAAARLGWTRDEVARGLIGAALEALDDGRLELDIERRTVVRETPVKTKKGTTTRRYHSTISTVKWHWGNAGEFSGDDESATS